MPSQIQTVLWTDSESSIKCGTINIGLRAKTLQILQTARFKKQSIKTQFIDYLKNKWQLAGLIICVEASLSGRLMVD